MMIHLGLSVSFMFLSTQSSTAKVYFKEDFNDGNWKKRWTVPSNWKEPSELGDWMWTGGKWFGDPNNKGLQTSQNSKFYGIIAPLDEPFTQAGDLVLQFSVKHENNLDCGGAYLKLLGGNVDMDSFGGETPYQIMFGPDICGSSTLLTHVIFHYEPKNENIMVKSKVRAERDQLTHLYTLHVMANGSYEVYIDQQSVRSGQLETDFDFLPPRTIFDPSISKPIDWVDNKQIVDSNAVKPDGWDDIPPEIPDPNAEKPDEWDEEEEGEWEPPTIMNPDYKGPWVPPMIDNPNYKGNWVHPKVPNPDYKEDSNLARRCVNCTHIGFELWQVTSGTIFDDIILTDSLEEAQEFANNGWASWKEREKVMYDEYTENERKQRLEAAQATVPDDEEDEEETWTHEEL